MGEHRGTVHHMESRWPSHMEFPAVSAPDFYFHAIFPFKLQITLHMLFCVLLSSFPIM